jgi:ADP-heptose:LPS heptosyltransferase
MKLFLTLDPLLSLERNSYQRAQPNGVLVLSCGGIGDQFLFSLFINKLKLLLKPEEVLTILVRHDTKSAEFTYPNDINVIYVNLKKIRNIRYRRQIGKKLYQKNFRLAITIDELRHPDTDEYLIDAARADKSFAMIPKPSIKYRKRQQKRQLMYHSLFIQRRDVRDKLERWNDFINWLTRSNTSIPDLRYHLPTQTKKPLLLLAPFSGNPKKHYDVSIFTTLLNSIPQHYEVVLCAHKNDINSNPDFQSLFTHPRVTINTEPFLKQAELIKVARLVICIDSAFLHLAALFNSNIIALMSAAYLKEYPYYPNLKTNIQFIYQEVDCKNCLGSCIHTIKDNRYPCVSQLNKTLIIEKIKTTINKMMLQQEKSEAL